MAKNKLKFNVGSIFEREEGAHADFKIDDRIEFKDKDFSRTVPVKTEVRVMKLSDEFNVTARDFETEIELVCSRCLKKFTQGVHIPLIEREFFFKKPHTIEDMDDLYLVDVKNTTIDLTELFRQEILLHFPFIPLCSLKCKGLCSVCGKDLNKGDCGHKTQGAAAVSNTHKPLLKLKELYGKTTGNKKKGSTKPDKKKI